MRQNLNTGIYPYQEFRNPFALKQSFSKGPMSWSTVHGNYYGGKVRISHQLHDSDDRVICVVQIIFDHTNSCQLEAGL